MPISPLLTIAARCSRIRLCAGMLTGIAMLFALTVAADDYRLGTGDLLRITVFGAPELSNEVRVSESGKITYPLVGELAVSGHSPAQVEAMLSARLVEGGFLREPQVSVLVLEYQSQKVAVLGHVAKPGQYALQASGTVLDMLAAAGGVVHEEAADIITLVRKDGTKTHIDLEALLDGDPEQNAAIAGGDTIHVPRAPQFYIYGEVQKPGVYRLERNLTVSRAISIGGGLTTRGSERRVSIKRRSADGREQVVSARGSDVLQPDDVLLVKEGWF